MQNCPALRQTLSWVSPAHLPGIRPCLVQPQRVDDIATPQEEAIPVLIQVHGLKVQGAPGTQKNGRAVGRQEVCKGAREGVRAYCQKAVKVEGPSCAFTHTHTHI